MAIKLYTVSGAPRGWRVLVGLVLKGLEFEVQHLQGSKNEQKQPEFLKINPRGMVPVLDHDGTIIRDSIAILAWLDREYPQKPIFGRSSDEAREIWQLTMECCDYLRDATNAFLFPVLVENIDLPKNNSEVLHNLQRASATLHAECASLEKLLDGTHFLVGNNPSAAEAIVFPEVRLIKRAIDRKPDIMHFAGFNDFENSYPKLCEWSDRVEALPNMEKTLPYHWSE